MRVRLPFLIISILLLNFSSKANPDFDRLKNEIIKNLRWFGDDLIYLDYERARIDIDSLASSTELKLRKLLTYNESINLDIKEFPNLRLDAYTQDSLRIRLYYFSNVVGPTGYEDVHTVCQWQSQKGKLFSFAISSKILGTIGSIYKLKSKSDQLYLVQSQDFYNTIIYVIQFKGDYLILDYPAFVNESSIILEHADVSFEPRQQKLSVKLYKEENYEMYNVVEPMRSKAEESESYKKILEYFKNKVTVNFIFNGRKFID
ncbi:MAG: hypothetical protein ABI772_01455 [Bacteroidota bacterium]